ncbi:MAG: hypothetical protein WAQ99_11860 [Pyrinomonadaceae bacterium]
MRTWQAKKNDWGLYKKISSQTCGNIEAVKILQSFASPGQRQLNSDRAGSFFGEVFIEVKVIG